jgi:hypothetical protein
MMQKLPPGPTTSGCAKIPFLPRNREGGDRLRLPMSRQSNCGMDLFHKAIDVFECPPRDVLMHLEYIAQIPSDLALDRGALCVFFL